MRSTEHQPSVVDAVAEGADERVVVDPVTGRNRYHLDPRRFDDLFQRGSCTAGTLNPRSAAVAEAFLAGYDRRDHADLVASQADRLRRVAACDPGEPIDVYFGHSGSDLAYWPNLFQRLLAPDRPIVHILSCPEELGAGSQVAAASRFYAGTNQFGDPVERGGPVSPGHQPVVVVRLAARDRQGRIMSRRRTIGRLIADNEGAACVGSLVFGSKSGIRDDLAVIADHPRDAALWVVDLCQFRVDRRLIRDLLAQGAMVMLTGSKFFGAPPFCGALLVPRSWSERLAAVPDPDVGGFGRVFSAYDVPPTVPALQAALPARENRGLRVRWEVALDEMEAYGSWPEEEANAMIDAWNDLVIARLAGSDAFRLMPDQHLTNRSIVSFQVVAGGRSLDHDELRGLFADVVTAEHEGLGAGLRRVFFGQPVQYGERAFVRLAIGSQAVRGFLAAGAIDPADDLRLIEILEDAARERAR